MKPVVKITASSCALGALLLWSNVVLADAARSCTGAPIADNIAAADPLQKGHFATTPPAAPPACNVPRVASDPLEPAADFHYKAFTFKNRSRDAACISVNTSSPVGVTTTAAYLGAFDPANIKSNYLSDSPTQFSMNVPGLADFTVVVTSTSATDVAFGLTVGGCGQMVLTGVTPAFGPVTGATPITISGSGFATTAPLTVTIGAAAATNVTLVDDSTLTATTAANAAGTYDVTATSAANAAVTSTLPMAFAYGATAAPDGGADAGADAATDGGGSTGGPTTGGPTSGSSSSSGGNDTGGNNDNGSNAAPSGGAGGDAGVTGDGGAKRVSAKKPKATAEDDSGFGCNEVGRPVSGIGTFAMALLGVAALLRKRRAA